MKKGICLLLALGMLLSLCACAQKPAQQKPTEQKAAEWTREGYYTDENDNMLIVARSEDPDRPGWAVSAFFGDEMTGWTIPQEGSTLHGNLNGWDESEKPFVVTISEEGEDGLLLQTESGESYHFKPMDIPEAKIFVTVNTEGMGNIDTAEGETAPVIDPEYPYQSTQINLAEPTVYTFLAWPQAGNLFVKWTKNGEDFSTEPQITVTLDESADFVAVFEDDADWQNPVMNFVGEYRCEKLHALVECMGKTEAWITIEQKESDTEATRWLISGKLNTDTLTISYTGSLKAKLVYDADGEVQSTEDEYEDGSGTVVFREDGSFLWHEDRAEDTEDRVFEWLPVAHVTENA